MHAEKDISAALKSIPHCGLIIAALWVGTSIFASTASAAPDDQRIALLQQDDTTRRAALPRILSAEDERIYRRAFALQQSSHWAEADLEAAKAKNPLLLGPLLYQRYAHPNYHSSYEELSRWLARFNDQPGAEHVYALAAARRPAGGKRPSTPQLPDSADIIVSDGQELDPDRDRTSIVGKQATQRAQQLWAAGLGAWGRNDFQEAEQRFAALAALDNASSWDVTGGAFWAARAALKRGRPAESNAYLADATKHAHSFYGILAARQLGRTANFTWNDAILSTRDLAALLRLSGVQRGMALSEIGRGDLAGREIRRLYARANDDLAVQLISLAAVIDAPAAALKLAEHSRDTRGIQHDAALYPLPSWRPQSGFAIDRALVFALMRQESGFEVAAKSGAGAAGLMQLMPRTAALIAGDRSLALRNSERLLDPGVNMEIGQKYIRQLLQTDAIRGNIILAVAAYNAGPGAVQRWQKTIKADDDPLLFLESIPTRETRRFVQKVVASFWVYRARLGQDEPSIDAIAGGKWPFYVSLDDGAFAIADHERN